MVDENVKCEHWKHKYLPQHPRASHWHTIYREWRCLGCVQDDNRNQLAVARKHGVEFHSSYISAEERLMQLLSGQ